MRPLALLCLLSGLGGCAALQPSAIAPAALQRDQLQTFALTGRFSLRQEDQSTIGRLNWRHAEASDELLLSSPLGQGMAEIVSDASGARLTGSDGDTHSAENVDQLLQSVLGYALPLRQLTDWVRGRNPDGGLLTVDALGRPLRLRHAAWRIDYEYDSDDPQALPGRLFVERDSVFELRLRIEQWLPLPAESAAR